MSQIWRKREVCDLASPRECGHESTTYEIIHKKNRRWKSWICSINTERRKEQGGLVRRCPELSLRGELGEHDCLTWPRQPHTLLPFFHCFGYKVCLTWTNIIINTSILNNTSVLSASKSAKTVCSRRRTFFIFFFFLPFKSILCCVVHERGRWVAQVAWPKSRLLKHFKKSPLSMQSSVNHLR